MREPLASDSSPLFGERVARQLGVGLLAGLAFVVAFTWWDASRVPERERFDEITAVGDENFYKAQTGKAVPGEPVAQVDGKLWKVAEPKVHGLRDTQMVRVARDEGRGVMLYRRRNGAQTEERFVKAKPNGYLRVAP